MDDAQLQTIWQQRQYVDRGQHIGQTLAYVMKYDLGKKVRQLGNIAVVWDDAIPEDIRDHTALEGFSNGVLTVMVDSAAHRFQLQTLLDGGLKKYIQSRFKGALNRIKLVPGKFSSIDLNN